MGILAGAKVSAVDLAVPDVAEAYGGGSNTVTATSWTDLPTYTCVASVTNPHPTADLLCLVTWGAWMSASANGVRMCPRVSGSTTIAAGISGIALGWGQIPRALVEYTQMQGTGYVALPASATAATFTLQAYRESASGTQIVAYPAMIIVPLRFLF